MTDYMYVCEQGFRGQLDSPQALQKAYDFHRYFIITSPEVLVKKGLWDTWWKNDIIIKVWPIDNLEEARAWVKRQSHLSSLCKPDDTPAEIELGKNRYPVIEAYYPRDPIAVWDIDDWLAGADVEEMLERDPSEIVREAWNKGIQIDGRPVLIYGDIVAVREWQQQQRARKSQ